MTLVLVAYGSKRDSTRQIAEWIGADLREAGFGVDVLPANAVRDVAPYHVVILGGALYVGRWHRHARRFVRRHAGMLRDRPVWLFSSGPLDDSADRRDIPPAKGVARAVEVLDARGHVTFGGRLSPDAHGFPASAMAQTRAGDFRNPGRVHTWTADIIGQLRAASR